MRAVKDSLPAPSGEGEESEGLRWTSTVGDQSNPTLKKYEQAWGEHVYRSTRAIKDHQAVLEKVIGN